MESNKDTLQPWAIATTASVTGLALLAVGLRLLSRYERKQKLWWDDWMIIFSMAWNLVVVGFIFAMIHEGMGLHASEVGMEKVVMIAKLLLVAEILYVYNLVWTKISLLMFYYRIFRFKYFKNWAYAIGAFIVAWVICITFLFVFICVPVQKLWYPQLPGRCINQVGTWIANAASTMLSDVAILVLPIPQVWKLQLGKSEKIALSVAFSLGTFVVFASAYRLTVLFSYTNADPSYTLAPTVGWTAIEMSAGIISACLPTLRPAVQFFTRRLGIQHLMPSLFQNSKAASSAGLSGTGRSRLKSSSTAGQSITQSANGSVVGHGRDTSDHIFYRLDDESGHGHGHEHGSQGGIDIPWEVHLRPMHDISYGYSVATGGCSGGKRDDVSVSTDELPLHSIRIHQDFKQVEDR